MSVRSWAVGVVATAAVVAGVVAVQSGISGTAALPILPHRTVTPAAPAGGVELPPPAEVGGPPGAGTVREAAVVSAEVAPEQRSAAEKPARKPAGPARPGTGKPGKAGKDDRSGNGPGHDSAKDVAKDAAKGPGKGPGKDSGGPKAAARSERAG